MSFLTNNNDKDKIALKSEDTNPSIYKKVEIDLRSQINVLTNKNYVLIEKNLDLYEKIAKLESELKIMNTNYQQEKDKYIKKIDYLESQMQRYMDSNIKLKERMEKEKLLISSIESEENTKLNTTANKFETSTELINNAKNNNAKKSVKGKLKSFVSNFLTTNDKNTRMSILKERDEQRKENLENFEADGFVFNIVTTNNEVANMNDSFYVESGAPKTDLNALNINKASKEKSASKQVINDGNSEFDKIDNDVTQMLYDEDGFEKMCKQFNIK